MSEGHFDFIYAISVFTHLTQHWAGWMAELHRVLADDGLLYATFLGPDWVPRLTGEERWPEEQVGVVALGEGAPWDEGGPCTFVSEWWLRAHWGRAFDFVSLEPSHEPAQGVALMRKRSPRVEAEELERPAATDLEREARALVFAQKAMLRNAAQHRAMLEQRSATLEQRLIDVQTQIELVLQSKSWRLTAPLRALAARARR